ncbi:GntR family transcriptional regulator [Brevibacterium yomogidense]|uniref:GntR family transcriptional regulator n=1 Tax=Brevibacterium yomogidense TaxID=946573 RepID=UPI0018DF2E8E|nr:GntR family transcriptional regulator [Brevibacterium yomogidense]
MSKAKHVEIREWIEGEIHSGRLQVGDRLPTERELMERFAVSRNPVQTAMSKLVETGLVQRRRGSGTVVASTGLRSSLLRLLRASTDGPEVEGLHRVVSTRVVAAENHPLSADLFPAGTPIAELVRIKLDSFSAGIVVERCVLNLALAPNILNEDLAALTTAAYYTSIGIEQLHASSVLSATHLSTEDAEHLGLDTTTPVVRQMRTLHTGNGLPIERLEMLFHPTKLTLEVTQIEH